MLASLLQLSLILQEVCFLRELLMRVFLLELLTISSTEHMKLALILSISCISQWWTDATQLARQSGLTMIFSHAESSSCLADKHRSSFRRPKHGRRPPLVISYWNMGLHGQGFDTSLDLGCQVYNCQAMCLCSCHHQHRENVQNVPRSDTEKGKKVSVWSFWVSDIDRKCNQWAVLSHKFQTCAWRQSEVMAS